MPYRAVSVTVVTAGSGQVAGSLRSSWPRAGAPPAVRAGARGGAGKYITRSQRSRPVTSTGRSAQQPGQPGQVIAGIEDDDDVRVALAASARPR